MDPSDLAIVKYALTLEYLESQFYAKVAKSGLFHGNTLSVLKSFGAEEGQYVIAHHKVASGLGTPATEPVGKFPIHSLSGGVACRCGREPRGGGLPGAGREHP